MDQEMAFVIERKGWGETKAIDRERGIVFDTAPLIDPDGLRGFFLDWHGQRVYFQGYEVGKNRFQDEHGGWKFDLEWVLNGISIPEGFPESRENVFQVICEALEGYGMAFSRDRVNSVKVTHNQNAYGFKMPDFNKKFWWHELGDDE